MALTLICLLGVIMQNDSNKRKYKRINTEIEIYEIRDSTIVPENFNKELIHGKTTNLSPIGAYIASENHPEPGMKLCIEFLLPDKNDILCVLGEIVWSNKKGEYDLPPGIGIQFINVDENTTKILEQHLGS